MTSGRLGLCAALICGVLLAAASIAQNSMPATIVVDEDGAVHVPAHVVPMSSMLSPEGRAYVTEHLHAMQHPEKLGEQDGVPALLVNYLKRQRELFRVERRDVTIGGVPASEDVIVKFFDRRLGRRHDR